jgi:opine dehydrogenase
MKRRVTIMGGGNGALTAAAELSINGHKVTLFELPKFADSVQELSQRAEVRATGVIEGVGPLTVTHDVSVAIDGAELIIIIVPTNYQHVYAELLRPHLRDGMNIALMPGSLGSLEFAEHLHQNGCDVDLTISEFAALPYACRIVDPGVVRVFGRRRYVSLGVFPANRTADVAPIVDDLYPGVEIMTSVLEAGLNNPNPTLHCLGVLLSASRIEHSRGEFYYYEEGLTPQVCKAVEAIDQERINVGAVLGVEVLSLKDTYYKMGYGPKGDTFWSVIRGVATLQVIKGPETIDSRYLTEDVPIGLTIYSQLGTALGIDTAIMQSVITLTGAILETDFAGQTRTLERCGIAGKSRPELLGYVQTGIGATKQK